MLTVLAWAIGALLFLIYAFIFGVRAYTVFVDGIDRLFAWPAKALAARRLRSQSRKLGAKVGSSGSIVRDSH